MKKIYKVIFLFLLHSTFIIQHLSFSQTAPGIEWQNTIGGDTSDYLYSVQQTSDGGYILCGYSTSNISGDKTENNLDTALATSDYWIVKIDIIGNIQWQNTIGGTNSDVLFSVQQASDGGFILGGLSSSNNSGDKTENSNGGLDYWIIKTDSIGNIQWQNTIGGSHNDDLRTIRQTSDGGYILGGTSNSNISGDKTENCVGSNSLDDYWVVKTDSSGNIQWQNTIGGDNSDLLNSIQQTADGGYILAGTSWSDISGDKTENNLDPTESTPDYWIVKTDSLGSIQWQNTIGGNGNEALLSIKQTSDGGYILGGSSQSNISGDKIENCLGVWDYWIVKTDSTGNIQWQNTIGGNNDDELFSISQTSEGGYVLGGFSNSNISGDKTENCIGVWIDYWVVKIDSLGNILWQNTIGGSHADQLNSIQQTSEGGYILGGSSRSFISGDKTENSNGFYDYWIVKLFPDTITGIPNYQLPFTNYQFSPNPLTTQSKLTFKNPNKEKFLFTLYDITGRINESVSTITNEIILTKGSKQAGVYLFNLVNEKNGERWNGKIVIAD